MSDGAPRPVLAVDGASLFGRLHTACGPDADVVTLKDVPPAGTPSGRLLGLATVARIAEPRDTAAPLLIALPEQPAAEMLSGLREILGEQVILVATTTSQLFGGDAWRDRRFVVDEASDPDAQVHRLLRILDPAQVVTPSRDEYGMAAAAGGATRSAALRGGVGAALVDAEGDVLCVGTAEVPAGQGGQYWDGDGDDARDFRSGGDPATRVRAATVEALLELLTDGGVTLPGPCDEVAADLLRRFDAREGSDGVGHGHGLAQSFESLGRVVHAEMAALCAAARNRIGTRDRTLFVTAQPCRQCLRHLVCSGLDRVVYLGRRLASPPAFHADAVRVRDGGRPGLRLLPFTGLAPGAFRGAFGPATATVPQWPAALLALGGEVEAELADLPASDRRDALRAFLISFAHHARQRQKASL